MRFIYEGAISSAAVGGAHLHFGGMARALDRSDAIDLELILPAFRGEEPLDPGVSRSANVRHVRAAGRSLPGQIGYELAKCLLIVALRMSDLVRRRPTVHMMRISPIGLSPLVSRCLGSVVVVEVNGTPDVEFAARGFPAPVVWIVRTLTTLQLRAATHVVTVTDGLGEAAQQRTKAPIMRLENAIDPDDLRDAIDPHRQGAKYTIAYSGAFAPWQELELLVRAFAALVHADPELDWRLILIGDGETRGSIQDAAANAGVADRVEITGWVHRDRSVERLLEASVAVVPLSASQGDGKSPLKLFEYLAIGRHVVASRVDGIVELEDYPIISYRCGDEVSLREALEEAISKPSKAVADNLLARLSWDDRCIRLLRFLDISPDVDSL